MPRVTVFRANPAKRERRVKDGWRLVVVRDYLTAGGAGQPVKMGSWDTQREAIEATEKIVKTLPGKAWMAQLLQGGSLVANWYGSDAVQIKYAGGIPPRRGWMDNPRRRATKKRTRRNPPVRQLGTLVSGNVHQIRYTHVQDGKNYEHKFGANVCAELLDDGSVRLFHAKGKPLMREF